MVGVEGRESAPFTIYSYVGFGYCEVGRRWVSVGGKAGGEKEIINECEVRVSDVECGYP